MARRRNRNEGLVEVLLVLPWWVSIALAAVAFAVMRWIIPASVAGKPILAAVATGIHSIAWLPLLVFGSIGAISFLRQKVNENGSVIIDHSSRTAIPERPVAAKKQFSSSPPITVKGVDIAFGRHSVEVKEQFNSWSLPALRALEWKRFELLCAKYYEAVGFKSETIRCGADGGIDVKLFKIDPSKPIAIVQCKAWNTQVVGVKEIRELFGVMAHEKVSRGIFVTTGSFTPGALSFGAANPIQLLDGAFFVKKLKELPETEQARLLRFAFEGDYSTPSCASCGINMVKRDGKRGAFWGCANYPRCKSTFVRKTEAG